MWRKARGGANNVKEATTPLATPRTRKYLLIAHCKLSNTTSIPHHLIMLYLRTKDHQLFAEYSHCSESNLTTALTCAVALSSSYRILSCTQIVNLRPPHTVGKIEEPIGFTQTTFPTQTCLLSKLCARHTFRNTKIGPYPALPSRGRTAIRSTAAGLDVVDCGYGRVVDGSTLNRILQLRSSNSSPFSRPD